MKATKEQRKEKALEIMKTLDIYKPYIRGFKEKDHVCFYENFGGFWAFQDKELMAKIKEIETEHNCTVYAITHEYMEFGECYSFLLVTQYPEEWDTLVEPYKRGSFYAFAYVWNKDEPYFSEFGTVVVQSFGGGLRRIF